MSQQSVDDDHNSDQPQLKKQKLTINNANPASSTSTSSITLALSTTSTDHGHRLGNFWNYPSFNPALNRMKLINDDIIDIIVKDTKGIGGLTYADLGCNEGELSVAMWGKLNERRDAILSEEGSTLTKARAIGIDIDSTLITRASLRAENVESIDFKQGNIADSEVLDGLIKSVHKDEGENGSERKRGVTLVSIFSTTMWIHLNLGDDLFLSFLRNACSHANYFIIEPQPERCYTNANKRLRKLGKPEFNTAVLKMLKRGRKGDEGGKGVEATIDLTIRECGFERVEPGKKEKTCWSRTIMLYRLKEGAKVK